ncbi:hypothetical protein FOZ60_013951 [Perkinsus olseni]|uniref:Uncharacterized protein n=1 Tax=Perkinsus olseni TaxID=32597 RepID=A0A7J6P970_PEROL|nr:hypothetical protein FOZ60_013951 [Perkinsus olseni]
MARNKRPTLTVEHGSKSRDQSAAAIEALSRGILVAKFHQKNGRRVSRVLRIVKSSQDAALCWCGGGPTSSGSLLPGHSSEAPLRDFVAWACSPTDDVALGLIIVFKSRRLSICLSSLRDLLIVTTALDRFSQTKSSALGVRSRTMPGLIAKANESRFLEVRAPFNPVMFFVPIASRNPARTAAPTCRNAVVTSSGKSPCSDAGSTSTGAGGCSDDDATAGIVTSGGLHPQIEGPEYVCAAFSWDSPKTIHAAPSFGSNAHPGGAPLCSDFHTLHMREVETPSPRLLHADSLLSMIQGAWIHIREPKILYEIDGSEVRRRRVDMDYGIMDSHTLCVCNDNVYWSNRLAYVCILYSRNAMVWKRISKSTTKGRRQQQQQQRSVVMLLDPNGPVGSLKAALPFIIQSSMPLLLALCGLRAWADSLISIYYHLHYLSETAATTAITIHTFT